MYSMPLYMSVLRTYIHTCLYMLKLTLEGQTRHWKQCGWKTEWKGKFMAYITLYLVNFKLYEYITYSNKMNEDGWMDG